MVYMSHVLEHSPSWIDARQLLDDCDKVLKNQGKSSHRFSQMY
jgi:hypothetical protein